MHHTCNRTHIDQDMGGLPVEKGSTTVNLASESWKYNISG